MAVEVGLYTRISDDPALDRGGVERQREDGAAMARARRWRPAAVYEDNDLSAYKRGVTRPRFEQMLRDLRDGVVKGIVGYNIDRLFRQPRDLERVIDIYEDHPEYVFATLEGDINLATSDGRTMARVMVAFANKASADTSRRVQRKQFALAQAGQHYGGARRTYGWLEDGKTVDPDAKEEIRKAHERIIAGDRIAHIQADWDARGIGPSNGRRGEGAPLRHSTVKRLLTRPALAGLQVYKGEVLIGEDGEPVLGDWDALCLRERLEAVTAALEARSPGTKAPGGNALKYLLSGIARCGLCGSPLGGSVRTRRGKAYPGYLCGMSDLKGCGKIARSIKPVDDLIIKLVLADQNRRKAPAQKAPPHWGGAEALAEVQSEIAELIEAKKAGQITMATLIQIMPDLERRRDELLVDRRRALLAEQQHQAATPKQKDEFDALSLERQRALVLRSLKAVIIHPAGPSRKFHPDQIEPLWAE